MHLSVSQDGCLRQLLTPAWGSTHGQSTTSCVAVSSVGTG